VTAPDDLTLVAGGRAVSGWTGVRVTRGIERCPSDFQVGLTERYPGEAADVVVRPGDACEVRLGDDLVITGYIDAFVPAIDGRSHQIMITGRGKCADLVDCPAIWPACQIVNSTVLATAQKLAKPYGIGVVALADVGAPVEMYSLRWGETAYNVIEEICRYKGLLAYDQPDGQLVLAQVGTAKAASGLKEGVNVERAAIHFDNSQRYSEYVVRRLGMDYLHDLGEGGNLLEVVEDQGIARYRPFWLVCENGDDGTVTKKRALWECARRAGRSQVVSVLTDSWRDSAGALYAANTLIDVDLPSLKLPERELLIAEVSYLRDRSGTHAQLVLMPPAAFSPEPILLMPTFADVPAMNGAQR
jgi:prophage tail gpP-like protein